jgi:steroid delta-isomerase
MTNREARGVQAVESETATPRSGIDGRELIIRHFDLIDAGEMDTVARLYEPDAVYQRPGYPDFLGRTAILRFYTELRPIRNGRHSLEAVIQSGAEIAVRGGFSGVLHDGGRVDLRFSDFFELGPRGWFTRRETFFCAPLT